MKELKKIFSEENCVAERFRNGQYFLNDDEVSIIDDFIIDIENQTKNDGVVNSKDVSNLIGIIETLYQAEPELDTSKKAIDLLNKILFKMERLKNM